MALVKNIKSPYGTDAAYHMIANMVINTRNMSAIVLIASYLSAETREAEKAAITLLKEAVSEQDQSKMAVAQGNLAQNQPMMSEEIAISTDVYVNLVDANDGDLRRRAVYDWLKATRGRYGGAVDV